MNAMLRILLNLGAHIRNDQTPTLIVADPSPPIQMSESVKGQCEGGS